MAIFNGSITLSRNSSGLSNNNISSFVTKESFNGDKNKLRPLLVINNDKIPSFSEPSLGKVYYNYLSGYLLAGGSLYASNNIIIVKELVKVSIKGRTSPMNFAINMSLNDRKSFN